ncbi:DIP1984 family protein [Phytoactinopolyspora halotolerans]|uniref:DIP1984 family protein n=1 Tax=Phytoactinopolyspora halotolerans TaxID=1981512 RepID=A0A6L9S0W0_9ACTN|nr:DIP1984 family protein [Phytoactinopolyspora halotolerans]NED98578.1 hypothetical protein [Phytoactinopolyspora halotolerans]
MKLAEALARRAELTTRFNELQKRATQSARFQEGEEPAEDARELLAESDRVADELEKLIRQINATNLVTEVEPGITMTDALAKRDVLRKRRAFRSELADSGVARVDRWMRSEIKMVSAVDVRELRHEADRVAAELRALDTRMQEVNWNADLVE